MRSAAADEPLESEVTAIRPWPTPPAPVVDDLFARPPAAAADTGPGLWRRTIWRLQVRTWALVLGVMLLGVLVYMGADALPAGNEAPQRPPAPTERGALPAPSAVVHVLDFASAPSPAEREAAQLIVAGRYDDAVDAYRRLAPQSAVYATIAKLLERRLTSGKSK